MIYIKYFANDQSYLKKFFVLLTALVGFYKIFKSYTDLVHLAKMLRISEWRFKHFSLAVNITFALQKDKESLFLIKNYKNIYFGENLQAIILLPWGWLSRGNKLISSLFRPFLTGDEQILQKTTSRLLHF